MSSFWNFVTQLTPGSLARAEDVNLNLSGISSGFDLAEAEINKSIQVTNAAGVTDIVLNASARANKLLAFDTNGDIAASQILGDWQGNHAAAAGTDYQIRDVVKDSTGAVLLGNIYICTATHTSTGTLVTDSANWDLLVDQAGLTDAGTLDGLDSTQFLRSDASQDGRLQISRTAATDSASITHDNAAGRGIYVYSNTASRTGRLVDIHQDNATGNSGVALYVTNDSDSWAGVFQGGAGGGAMQVVTGAASTAVGLQTLGQGIGIEARGTATIADVVNILNTTLTSGKALSVTVNSASMNTNVAQIIQDHVSATGRTLYMQQDGVGVGAEVYSNAASRTGALLRLINQNATGTGRGIHLSQSQGGAGIYSDALSAAAESGHFYSNIASRSASVLRVENLNSTGTGRAVEITQNQGGAGLYSTSAINTAESGHFHSNTASRVTSVLRVENLNTTGTGVALDVSQSQGGHALAIASNNAGARAIRAYSNTVDRTVPLVDIIADVDSFDVPALRVEGDFELVGSSGLKGNFINWNSPAQLGNDLNITTVVNPALTALNGTDVAFIDGVNDSLRTYRFDGTTWSLVGNGLSITTVGTPAVAALNGTDIAFADNVNRELRTYRFDGTDWAQVGNSLSISLTSSPAMTALNGTDVAIIESFDDDLRTYRFDGTDWVQVGNDFNIASAGTTALAALNGTDVAFIDQTNDDLRTYRFDGTDWAQVGNDLNISGVGIPELTALNGTDVVLIDETNDDLTIYRFDGTDWAQVGNPVNISGAGIAAMAALNGTDIAFIDDDNDDLRTYRFSFSVGAGPHLFN